MQPNMFSRTFWRGKLQSWKSHPSILRRASRRTISTQVATRDIAAQRDEPIQVFPLAADIPSYTVQAGDTFYLIARKLGMSVDAIEAANPGVRAESLQIGQVLRLQASSTMYTIQAGDTFYTIAKKLGIDEAALEAANPTVNVRDLKIGSQIILSASILVPVQPQQPAPAPAPAPVPTPPTGSSYRIQAGDNFYAIAKKFGTTAEVLEAANPTMNPMDLQIGAQMIIPNGLTPTPDPVPITLPAPAPAPAPTPVAPAGTYVIQKGDSFFVLAARFGLSVEVIESANPGVIPIKLEIGQVINIPTSSFPATVAPNPSERVSVPAPSTGGAFVNYGGPAANFPDPSLWASYSSLWAQNAALMSYSNSPSEIASIGKAISIVAAESGIDARIILCIIMQESGGNVRVGNTFNGVNNTGIMQAFDGVSFNPSDPAGSILQMVRDGAEGTARGDGLKQNFAQTGNWYEAARKYNSGSVDRADLNNALGATAGYVVGFANRILGHSWPNM